MKIKGVLFVPFVVCVGYFGAMEPDKGTAQGQLQSLITQQLPEELQIIILTETINQLEAPFPKKPGIKLAMKYLSLIAQFSLTYKKQYLNEFAKKWYLNYGKELKLPSTWLARHFPGQNPKQVLDYGFSIQDYLNSPILKKKIKIIVQRELLDLRGMK